MQILANLVHALQLERDAHSERFRTLTTTAPVRTRVAEGIAWYPVKIRETGYGFGEYPFVVVERMGAGGHHQLSGGKPCEIFSVDGTKQVSAAGTLHWVTGNVAHITLRDNEHPEWLDGGRIGVQLTHDASGFRDMFEALTTVQSATNNRVAELRDVLFGNREPTFAPLSPLTSPTALNASQQHALQLALSANDVAVIHGPPGTGKTTTVVELVRRAARERGTVLVTAPSNAAVDLLTERCSAAGLDVLRLGNLARIDPAVTKHTLDERWKSHPLAQDIKDMRKRADEFRRLALKYKRSFGRSEMEQRKLLLKEARSIVDDARRMERQITDIIIDGADVVACTLVACRNHEVRDRTFGTVVVDEAGQALDPALCIPLLRAERIILSGDPHQLPPTVVDQTAARNGLGTTALERYTTAKPGGVALLAEQYRMNTVIMGYSNATFYGNRVVSHTSVENHTIPLDAPLSESMMIVDTSGRGWDEEPGEGTESLANVGEVECVSTFIEELSTLDEANLLTIGVISPYRGQVRLLEQTIGTVLQQQFHKFEIDTVDSFQGSEADVIIISLVRSNSDQEIGFLADTRRMNVAITRARKKLIIIGNGSTVAAHPFFRGLWEYVEANGTLKSAWE